MKTSTLMTTVLLSASCFAAPVHTAQDVQLDRAGPAPRFEAQDVPVAPPAPNVPVTTGTGPQHWQYLTLPRSRRLDQTLSPALHLQT